MALNIEEQYSKRRWQRGFTAGLTLITAGLGLFFMILIYYGCTSQYPLMFNLLFALGGLAFSITGLLIVTNRPGNTIGWLLMIGGFGLTCFTLDNYISCHIEGQQGLPRVEYVAWFSHRFTAYIAFLPIFVFLPFLFPTGRFLTRRWRYFGLSGLTIIAIILLFNAFAPDLRVDNGFSMSFDFDSPISLTLLSPRLHELLFRWQNPLILVLSFGGILSMILRLKRSRGIERQQMKWFVYFLATAVSVQLFLFELPFGIFGDDYLLETISWLESLYTIDLYVVFLGYPLVIGLAVLRYRLYDIDIIIRRTLVYTMVTVSLVFIYFASVIMLQSLFTGFSNQQSPLAIVISTLFIAALFNPIRKRVQNFIDRRFYRKKYDAQQVLTCFAHTARDETDIEVLSNELVQVVQESIQPENIGIWLKKGSS